MLRYFRRTSGHWAWRTNGHSMLNGKKMSKSTGNSLTLREAIEKFGVDATRLSLADAGDGLENADFEEKAANANILRVRTLLGWCEVTHRSSFLSASCSNGILRNCSLWKRTCAMVLAITTIRFSFRKLMTSSISLRVIMRRKSHHNIPSFSSWLTLSLCSTGYKDALKFVFYDFQSIRDRYRESNCGRGYAPWSCSILDPYCGSTRNAYCTTLFGTHLDCHFEKPTIHTAGYMAHTTRSCGTYSHWSWSIYARNNQSNSRCWGFVVEGADESKEKEVFHYCFSRS